VDGAVSQSPGLHSTISNAACKVCPNSYARIHYDTRHIIEILGDRDGDLREGGERITRVSRKILMFMVFPARRELRRRGQLFGRRGFASYRTLEISRGAGPYQVFIEATLRTASTAKYMLRILK